MNLEINHRLIVTKYDMGDVVYYKTDKENVEGMVIGISVSMDFSFKYVISFAGDIHACYEDELRNHKEY